MKLDLIPVTPDEEARAWNFFNESPMKAVLHNELVKKIHDLRDKLEGASTVDVPNLQSEIKATRSFLGLIHRNDSRYRK